METSDKKLTDTDFREVAKRLGLEVAIVKAVKEVETGRYGGFFAPGKPAILFEGQVFWRQLKKREVDPNDYLLGNEDILYKEWTNKHYKEGIKEYDRLNRAKHIHEAAALCSASWGMFQIMGFNYALCGCKDVESYVEEMCKGEREQLEAFAHFLINRKLIQPLCMKNWSEFARQYNGPLYEKNEYDKKLEMAYGKYNGAKG
ncbi:MAG: N-acetylmuramidase family protein [Prevotellaceae bacterium]|jgi:hypothetical protein|nr:N-acetylmuramidase family protein [Prevotellaceae bacterium]